MKTFSFLFSSSLVMFLVAGCDQSSSNSAPSSATDSSASHAHADGTTHAEHTPEASADTGHSHGGDIVALGTKEILEFTVTAEQEGTLVAGQDAVFLIETAPASEAVRLWVGDEQATNSVRSKAEGGPTSFHAYAAVPDSLNEAAQLWVEVQNSDGGRGSVSFDLGLSGSGSHGHDHDEVEAHGHDHDSEHAHDEDTHDHAEENTSDHDHEPNDGDHGHSH